METSAPAATASVGFCSGRKIHDWIMFPVFELLDSKVAMQTIGDPSIADGPE
jgi:hypothetical protein